jgi:hypothetical protein
MDANGLFDEYSVRNLYAAFAATIDAGDADGFADCFTPDGALSFVNIGAVAQLLKTAPKPFLDDQDRIVGRDRLREFVWFVTESAAITIALHVTTNVWIKRLDGDAGDGEAAFTALSGADGSIGSFGRLYDKFARCPDGRWRFTERREVFHFMRGA